MNRRNFFQAGLAMAVTFFLHPLLSKKGALALAATSDSGDLPILKMDDPAAKKNGYNYDALLVDTKKWKQKAGKNGANQKCITCTRYTKIDDNHGKCDIFPKNTVNWNAWCTSWAKK